MKTKRIINIIIFIIASLVMLSSCSKEDNTDSLSGTSWGSYKEGQILKSIVFSDSIMTYTTNVESDTVKDLFYNISLTEDGFYIYNDTTDYFVSYKKYINYSTGDRVRIFKGLDLLEGDLYTEIK